MTECSAHPGVEAVRRCSVCGRDYCNFCFLRPDSQVCQFCESRSNIATNVTPNAAAPATSQNATIAFILSLFGLFCCGIIVEPIAFILALNAKKRSKPTLGCKEKGWRRRLYGYPNCFCALYFRNYRIHFINDSRCCHGWIEIKQTHCSEKFGARAKYRALFNTVYVLSWPN